MNLFLCGLPSIRATVAAKSDSASCQNKPLVGTVNGHVLFKLFPTPDISLFCV